VQLRSMGCAATQHEVCSYAAYGLISYIVLSSIKNNVSPHRRDLGSIPRMGSTILNFAFLSVDSVHLIRTLYFQFAEKRFEIEQIAPQISGLVLWFLHSHDRRRYAITLGWNGYLWLRKYGVDGTRQTLFESQQQRQEDFNGLLDAFLRSESDRSCYEIEIETVH
jgi:hypothetical protein